MKKNEEESIGNSQESLPWFLQSGFGKSGYESLLGFEEEEKTRGVKGYTEQDPGFIGKLSNSKIISSVEKWTA